MNFIITTLVGEESYFFDCGAWIHAFKIGEKRNEVRLHIFTSTFSKKFDLRELDSITITGVNVRESDMLYSLETTLYRYFSSRKDELGFTHTEVSYTLDKEYIALKATFRSKQKEKSESSPDPT